MGDRTDCSSGTPVYSRRPRHSHPVRADHHRLQRHHPLLPVSLPLREWRPPPRLGRLTPGLSHACDGQIHENPRSQKCGCHRLAQPADGQWRYCRRRRSGLNVCHSCATKARPCVAGASDGAVGYSGDVCGDAWLETWTLRPIALLGLGFGLSRWH